MNDLTTASTITKTLSHSVSEEQRKALSATVCKDLLRNYFWNPNQRIAVQLQGSGSIVSAEFEDLNASILTHVLGGKAPVTTVHIASSGEGVSGKSVTGHFRVGFYLPGADGKTQSMCFDFDGSGHKNPLSDVMGAAVSTLKKLNTMGIPAYLEQSGSGKGWHIWVFFSEPIKCGVARAFGLFLVPKDAALSYPGQFANPEAGRGIEVFPKQSEWLPGSKGNQVWLPFYAGAPEGANQFYRLLPDGSPQIYFPEIFDRFSASRAKELADQYCPPEGKFKKIGTPAGETLAEDQFLEPNTEAVVQGCGYVQYCRENKKNLDEPTWYALASLLVFVPGGEKLFHELSEEYPGYDYSETEQKFNQARTSSKGPRTCRDLAERWDGCRQCKHFAKVKSPVQIGMLEKAQEMASSLRVRLKDDPGAPFEKQMLIALRILKTTDPATFARLTPDLKAAGVSLRDLNRSLKVGSGDRKAGESDSIYSINHGCLSRNVQSLHGEFSVPLCNFTASITGEEIHDDGADRKLFFAVEGQPQDGSQFPKIQIPAEEFVSMNWPMKLWGVRAIINAGSSAKDHVRAAIQSLSDGVICTEIFTHTGWRKVKDASWVYLNGEGAIGTEGTLKEIRVSLGDGRMKDYRLPPPPKDEELKQAILASLSFLDLGPIELTFPLLSAVYRAVLGEAVVNDLAMYIVGKTGVFKSELSSIALAHFGSNFTGRNLPANWSSTGNALERQAFLAKDVLLVVDDYAPRGGVAEVQKLIQKADQLIRGAGNGTGRGRLYSSGALRPQYFSRAVIIATGEDIPRGHSLLARLLILEVKQGEIDPGQLTRLQQTAQDGILARSMAGFIQWLAPQMDQLKRTLTAKKNELRTRAERSTFHRRTPDIVANLMLGFETLMRFACESRAISEEQASDYMVRGWETIAKTAQAQARYQSNEDPCQRFIDLLVAAFESGQAYVAGANNSDSASPANGSRWGWKDHLPQGAKVGWLKGDELILNPDVALNVVHKMAQGQTEGIALSKHTLGKHLADRGWILSEGSKHTVKRTVEDSSRDRYWVFPQTDRVFHSSLVSNTSAQEPEMF